MSWMYNKIADNHEFITAIASIVSVIAFLVATWKIYEAKNILEYQATASALRSGREFMYQLEQNPSALMGIYGSKEKDIAKVQDILVIDRAMNLFSEQFIATQAGVLPKEHWEKFRADLCDLSKKPAVKNRIEFHVLRNSYPKKFENELLRCDDESN